MRVISYSVSYSKSQHLNFISVKVKSTHGSASIMGKAVSWIFDGRLKPIPYTPLSSCGLLYGEEKFKCQVLGKMFHSFFLTGPDLADFQHSRPRVVTSQSVSLSLNRFQADLFHTITAHAQMHRQTVARTLTATSYVST